MEASDVTAGGGHGQPQLGLKNLENALHAGRAVSSQSPALRPAYANRRGAQRQRLQNVASAPEPAIDQDWHLALDGIDDFGQDLET